MTDEHLIELVEQGHPASLPPEVIELIRVRLAQSEALRRALADRLRIEAHLAGALGAEHVSVERIIALAAARRGRGARRHRWMLAWGLAIIVPIAAFTAAYIGREHFSWSPVVADQARDEAGIAGANAQGASPAVEPVVAEGTQVPKPSESLPPIARQEATTAAAAQKKTTATQNIKPPKTQAPPAVGRAKPALWETERHLGSPVRSFAEVYFDDVGQGGFSASESDLKAWFAPVPGQSFNVDARSVAERRVGFFAGVVRLRAPWSPDVMLRLALTEANKLRMYFWNGTSGVMLHFHEDRRVAWAAYAATRKAGAATPSRLALTATDEDRSYRTSPLGAGPIDIYWHQGELVLSRGDVKLLAAPLAGPPSEVVFEGKAGL
ncbi:MAG: hypothetical protein WD176_07675, partial [Pirellulales bacterium]